MKASDVMSSPVYIVSPEENIAHARNLMLKHHISRLPVMAGTEQLEGIITRKDIAYGLRQTEPVWRRRPIDRIPVRILMTPDPITITPGTGTREIAGLMVNNNISGIPVSEREKIVGIVTKSDLLKSSLVKNLSLTAEDLMGDVITVSRYHSLDHLINLMRERNDKILVMNHDGTIAGIITESNIAFFEYISADSGIPEKDVKILRKEQNAGQKKFRYVMDMSAVAEDLMTRPVVSVTPDTSVSTMVQLMAQNHISCLVVEREGELQGIVKRDDIIREVAK
ncbi:MAG: CBS domain-containing protein [Methanomicrobiales archaeon]|nr:CBS domain-containing protein [Methanomicrobiales archaeon]